MNLKIKICGMRDPENIRDIAALKPDFLGFIFFKGSPRYVGEDFRLDSYNYPIKKVGIFVDQGISEISEIISKFNLDVIQLHGHESPELCSVLKGAFPELEVWKVFSVDENFDFNNTNFYDGSADKYLFDTKGAKAGGSGISFDWKLLSKYGNKKECIIAGGIGADNIEAILELKKSGLNLSAIDVNSKVEIEPGLKSKTDVETLLSKVRSLK